MVTKKYNIFLSWFNNEGTYNEEAMQHDQLNIINYLHNEGYADATVEIQICEASKIIALLLSSQLTKGPSSRRKITFEGYSYSAKKIFDVNSPFVKRCLLT